MRVAIVGAGIAGLTAALSFARIGWHAIVFERVERIEPIGAGIQLSPNAMHVMRALGLERAINGVASAPRSVELKDAVEGQALVSVPLGMAIERRFGAPSLSVHRGDLQRVMLDASRQNERVTIETGRAIEYDDHDLDGFDLRIFASGIHSTQRVEERPAELTAWRALVQSRALSRTIKTSSTGVWLAPGAHLVHYPVRSGLETNLVLVLQSGKERPENYAATSAKWCEDAASVVRSATEWRPWPITERMVREPWVRDKRVLIGDAAHAMWPFAAQGGAMAIEDGWSLAAQVANGPSLATLAEWERERRRRRETVAAISRRNRSIYHATGMVRIARNIVMRSMPAAAMMRAMNGVYEWKPALLPLSNMAQATAPPEDRVTLH